MAYIKLRTILFLLLLAVLAGCKSNSQIRDSDQIKTVASPLVQIDVMIMIGVHEKIYTGDKRPTLVAARPLRKEGRTFIEIWTVESAGKKVEYRVTLEIDFMGTRYSLTRLSESTSTASTEKTPAGSENAKAIDINQYRPLLEGKTVSGEHLNKGFKFKDYFDPDGSLIEVRDNGKTKKGKWTISNSGYLCIIWKNKKGCGHLTLNNDGTILFARDGRHIRQFTHFSSGKNLK